MKYLLKHRLFVILILFLILFIMGLPFFNLPHFWDGILWVNSAEWMSRNNLNPILPGSIDYGGLDVGHPPFFLFILALAFYLLGTSLIVSHLVMLLFAFLTAYFTYLLGSYLFDKKVGFISLILLLFSPIFYAQTHVINLDLPLTAFAVMTLYFALRNKTLFYLISASLLVLTKEPGVFVILAIVIYTFIKNSKNSKKILFKKCFICSLPLLALLFWISFHWTQQNAVILGHSTMWRPITFIILFRLVNRVRVFFFDDFHWILTFFIFFSLLINTKKINIKKIIISIGMGLISLFLFSYGFKFLLSNVSSLEAIFSLAENAFYINKQNLQGILSSFYSQRFIFAIFIAVIPLVISAKNLSFFRFKNKKLIPIFLIFLFYFILFSWTFYQPRYSLLLCPFFFILSSNALNKIFKKNLIYLIIFIIIIVFITQWFGDSNDTRGYLLEKNLEYKDSILTHKNMANYIENTFPDATILSYSFMTDELRYPHLGYAKLSFNPLDYSHYDPKTKKTDFTLNIDDWYYYECYSKNQCGTSNLIPVGQGDIRLYDIRYKAYLTDKDFDLFYYSPQSPLPRSLLNLVDDFNLILIKRFESNGKYTELYATRNFLSEITPKN